MLPHFWRFYHHQDLKKTWIPLKFHMGMAHIRCRVYSTNHPILGVPTPGSYTMLYSCTCFCFVIAHGLLIHIWYHICFGCAQVWPNPTGPCRRRGTVLTLALPCRPAAQHCWRRQRRCGYGIHWEICWICCWICWPYVAPSTSFNSRKPWLFFCDSFLGLVGKWWGQEHIYIYITSCKHSSIYLGLRYLNSTDIGYIIHVTTMGMYDISGTLHHQISWWCNHVYWPNDICRNRRVWFKTDRSCGSTGALMFSHGHGCISTGN